MSTVATSSRWPVGLLDRIQRYADAHGISRQAAMSVLCSVALLDWERANHLPPVVLRDVCQVPDCGCSGYAHP